MSIKKQPMWMLTSEYLIVVFEGEPPFQLKVQDPRVASIMDNLQYREDYDGVYDLLTPEKKVSQVSKGAITVETTGQVKVRGKTTLKEEDVDPIVKDYLPEYLQKGLSLDPLRKLAIRINKITNKFVKDQLVRFLRSGKLPILPDGRFLAYKGVERLLRPLGRIDAHSKTFRNDVGCTPRMLRSQVVADPHALCVAGLHVGTWGYMGSYSTVMAVAVAPEDVVSVPYEYQSQKMRTCGYEVLLDGITSERMALDFLEKNSDPQRFYKTRGENFIWQLVSAMSEKQIREFLLRTTGSILPSGKGAPEWEQCIKEYRIPTLIRREGLHVAIATTLAEDLCSAAITLG